MAITKSGRSVALVLIGALCATFLSATPHRETREQKSLGVLRILSVRQMTKEEYAGMITDNIGANYVIRYRFEAPADAGIYLYSPLHGPPIGYGLERSRGVVKWDGLPPGEDSSKNPGFKKLERLFGSGWISLTPRAAIEWESDTRPTGDSEVALCLFVKIDLEGEPTAVLSPWSKIPSVDASLTGKPK